MSRMFYFCVTTMLMFVAFFGGYDVSAQGDADPADIARQASEETERRRPLPTYYGKIGVTDEQREQLYGIQDEYHTQIDALQRQIKQLIRERDDRMEQLLTPGQKLRLQELREEARRRAQQRQSARSSEADSDAPTDSDGE
ncbi:hypothetical protein Mal4_54480 [Maioricimonas rarisocia]|uniref:LTXXQ motif protein n=1 Tax=Maioricimonas rarisocia TaxID=2528026 RepID=A0A517ZF03_9PLAN|nr:hypothetical protein [Maioricimonas rarisocia]QDU41083.1 hypothetical protein Mal4_54480 [Maioricimonas rarisocia]